MLYKIVLGIGIIICDNGVCILVKIIVKGGGLMVGKFRIVDGKGKFFGVYVVNDLFGFYVLVEVYVGVEKFGNV